MDQKGRRKPGTWSEMERARHVESSGASRVRHKKRKRRFRIFYVLLFLVVLGVVVTLLLTVLFQIHFIQVTGTSRYSQEQIISVRGIQKGENLFPAKTKQAETSIGQKFPYIRSVKVSRRLPVEISIQVEVTQVTGAIETNGSHILLNTSGKVLGQTKRPPENTIMIAGLALSPAAPGKQVVYKDDSSKALYEQLVSLIKTHPLASTTKVDISDPYRIPMVYDGRVTMNLGSSAGLDYKIRSGKEILTGENGEGEDNIGKDEKGVPNLSSAKEDDRAYFNPNGVLSSAPAQAASNSRASSPSVSSGA